MLRKLLSSALLATLFACQSEGGSLHGTLATTSLDSPTGVGSGEVFLSTTEDAVLLSWLEPIAGDEHALWVAELGPEGWSERRLVSSGDDFFVNWADFPSVRGASDGSWWAHWLQRGADGGYDYGVRVSRSVDRGATWSEPWMPHEDGTPTEHGFVSLFPVAEGMGLVWLDGRRFADGPDGQAATREMTLRFREAREGRAAGPDRLVDARVCDCCQTDVALAREGPVVVYRNRTERDIRDIYVTRLVDGAWSEGVPVGEDGWHIEGCPVNGPAVAARGDTVVVAWFTGADDTPRVQVAFSQDGGRTFAPGAQVDGGSPAGRVDLVLLASGHALVSWIERTGGEKAEVRLRTVGPDASLGDPWTVTRTSDARASGFPRMAVPPWDADGLLLAWTDVSDEGGPRVQVTRVEIPTT